MSYVDSKLGTLDVLKGADGRRGQQAANQIAAAQVLATLALADAIIEAAKS